MSREDYHNGMLEGFKKAEKILKNKNISREEMLQWLHEYMEMVAGFVSTEKEVTIPGGVKENED